MDVGTFFKIIKPCSRMCTSKNSMSPLRNTMEDGLKKLSTSGKLLLPPKKKGAIVDCVAIAPEVKGKAFSSKLIKNAFIDSGFTSGIEGDGDPNMHAIMRASNVQFNSNTGLQELFYKSMQHCVAETFAVCSISEETHDSLGFPIDVDCEGNLWIITSQSLVFARSQPIITIDALQRRIERTVQTLEEARSARVRDLQKARTIITQAAECSQLLFKAAGIPSSSSESIISGVSYEIITKASTGNLEAFVRVRVQEDLLKIWKAPAKGSKKKIEDGMLCSKTKGKLLMQLSKDLASKESICKDLHISETELPAVVARQDTAVERNLGHFVATKEWCAAAYFAIFSVDRKGMVRDPSLDSEALNSTAAVFSGNILSRLSSFLIPRFSHDRTDLRPGRHCCWNSFASKLKHISVICALSDNVPMKAAQTHLTVS